MTTSRAIFHRVNRTAINSGEAIGFSWIVFSRAGLDWLWREFR
jgi:hypothetical protein